MASRSKRRGKRRTRRLRRIAAITVAVIIVAALAVWLLTDEKTAVPRGDASQRYAYDNLIDVDGSTYRQKKTITTVLLMGIDDRADVAYGNYRNGGQADFLRLLLIDSQTREVAQVAIDRDTITPITILSVLGKNSGKRALQICLSHGYGDGGEQSCEFTVEAVSGLYLGLKIDYYVAFDISGIPALNDALDGITITAEEDLTDIDLSLTEGSTVVLNGELAERFVRARLDVGDGSNVGRMSRQEIFISALSKELATRVRADKQYVGELYDELQPYLTTNMSRGSMINTAWNAYQYERLPAVSVEGEHVVNEAGYMEFYPDETAQKQLTLGLFYEQLK